MNALQINLNESNHCFVIYLLFNNIFSDAIMKSKELGSLNFFEKEFVLLQIFMNILQISVTPLIIGFLLPLIQKIQRIMIILNLKDTANSRISDLQN